MDNKHGALPPADHAWQIGKTAASICFVKEAEDYMKQWGIPPGLIAVLQAAVEKVKSGKVVLTEKLTPLEYLATTKF